MSEKRGTTSIVYYIPAAGAVSVPRIYLKAQSFVGYCSLAKTDENQRYVRINLDSLQTNAECFAYRRTHFEMLHQTNSCETIRYKNVKWYRRGKLGGAGKFSAASAEIVQDFLYASKLAAATVYFPEKEPNDDPPAYEETNSHTPEETVIKCAYRHELDYNLKAYEFSGNVKTYRFTVVRQRLFRNRYFAFEIQCPTKCEIQVIHSEIRYHSNILEAHKRRLQLLLMRAVGDDRWLLPVTVLFDTVEKSIRVQQGECRYLGCKTGMARSVVSRKLAPNSFKTTPFWNSSITSYASSETNSCNYPQSAIESSHRLSRNSSSDSDRAALLLAGFTLGLWL